MNDGKMLFAQLMDFLPWTTFTRYVQRHGGDRGVRTLPGAEQFRVMAFAQLTYRQSLRDIETCLTAQARKLYTTWVCANRFGDRCWRRPTSCVIGGFTPTSRTS